MLDLRNETSTVKIRQYRVDYNNRPSHTISFIPVVAGTTDHLHCELVSLFFFQNHRKTDLLLSSSGVQLVRSNLHLRRVEFSSQVKSKVGNILVKSVSLRMNLNIDGSSIASSLTLTHHILKPLTS